MTTRPSSSHFTTPGDLESLDFDRDIGLPGEFPFTRGVQPDMYRGRPWTMRQYAGFADAAESNKRFLYLLEQGVSGLSVAFDLPTQIGYDSDHPLAAGEVGRVGVAIDSIEDMATLFANIPLDRVSTSMTINATAIILLALYAAVARRQNVALAQLSGTLQNDILKEYVARGTHIYPPRPSMRIVTDVIGFCAGEMPRWNPISISGYHIREAGSTAAQEIAFTLSHARAYVQAAVDTGLDANVFGQRISFFFSAHNGFIQEIAKFRAARRMWARIMRDQFGATNPRAQQLRFHAQTAGSTLTAQQPDNNIVRVAIQALSAVLGGTQSLHTNGRDEALALPTEESATIALRTQQILLHETGVANAVDPVGGAYEIEQRTAELEREALELMERVDAAGGALSAIESGYVRRQIQDEAYRAQQAIDTGDAVVVGVNKYGDRDSGLGAGESKTASSDSESRIPNPESRHSFTLNPALEEQQIERVRAVRAGRSEHDWNNALTAVERAARDGSNLVPSILAATEKHATLGEIADTLRRVFGEYHDASTA
ncbi:MAG: methylmalonyl-CoA mutase [Acidobacteria bacterium]|nr:methylmalonyl-CoA mutase [Acidobacteriota bacterium]